MRSISLGGILCGRYPCVVFYVADILGWGFIWSKSLGNGLLFPPEGSSPLLKTFLTGRKHVARMSHACRTPHRPLTFVFRKTSQKLKTPQTRCQETRSIASNT